MSKTPDNIGGYMDDQVPPKVERRPRRKKAGEHILSDGDIAAFWVAMDYWRDRFGLHAWRVHYSSKEATGQTMAACTGWDRTAKMVTVRVGTNWLSTEPTPETISVVAMHECLHILLSDLIDAAIAAGEYSDEVLNAEHGVINTLERLLPARPEV